MEFLAAKINSPPSRSDRADFSGISTTQHYIRAMLPNFPYSIKSWLRVLSFILAAGSLASPLAAQPVDRNGAVIFAYQRVGEDLYPSNNISTAQFSDNIRELIEDGYTVLPLPEIVAALRNGSLLPDRAVAITFDGAYRSAYDNAIPLLLSHNLPFTVFFSPHQAAEDSPQYMDWNDLKRLARKTQVTLGLHPASYTHLVRAPEKEIRRQVNNALALYRKELKQNPALFAYPFGEYTSAYRDIIAASGFDAAFGQHSGAVYAEADLMALPRFALTDNYGDTERFRMAAQAMPLPATDISPEDPHVAANNPPIFGFTVPDALTTRLDQLSCFVSEQGKLQITVVGKTRVEMRVEEPFEGDRIRFNCTMPGPPPKPGEEQRWRWFGMLLTQGSAGTEETQAIRDSATESLPFPDE